MAGTLNNTFLMYCPKTGANATTRPADNDAYRLLCYVKGTASLKNQPDTIPVDDSGDPVVLEMFTKPTLSAPTFERNYDWDSPETLALEALESQEVWLSVWYGKPPYPLGTAGIFDNKRLPNNHAGQYDSSGTFTLGVANEVEEGGLMIQPVWVSFKEAPTANRVIGNYQFTE